MLVRNLKYTTYLKQCHYTKLCFGIIIYLIYKLNCEIVYDNKTGIFSHLHHNNKLLLTQTTITDNAL